MLRPAIATMAVLIAMTCMATVSRAQQQSAVPAPPAVKAVPEPELQKRSAAEDDDATSVREQVGPQGAPAADASGHYELDHDRESLEADFDPSGMTGYLTVAPPRESHEAALSYFFAKTTVSGAHIQFVTHEVHRVRYEFDGTLSDAPTRTGGLARDYTLQGVLTERTIHPEGADEVTQRAVTLRKFAGMR